MTGPRSGLLLGLTAFVLMLLLGCGEKTLDAFPEEYVGIGVELTMEAAGARVVRVIEGGPAAASGIHAGDILLDVEGRLVRGKTLAQLVRELRGAPGTRLRVTARTPQGNQGFTLTRKALRDEAPAVASD